MRILVMMSLVTFSFSVLAVSPYAGQQSRNIKSLSDSEVSALLQGKGMGLAKAAELNQYPGPKHVLELKDKLHLSEEQLRKTYELFSAMKNEAIQLGKQIIDKEKKLDDLFSSQKISTSSLQQTVREIGALHAELRYVHLKTHLKQKELLSDMQLKRYDHLRGYSGGHNKHHEHMHHQ